MILSEPVEPWDFAALRGAPAGRRLAPASGRATRSSIRRRSAGRSPATASIATASATAKPVRLVVEDAASGRARAEATAEAVYLARDLINTPASDLGPAELAEAAEAVATRFGAEFRTIEGDRLLAENYPGDPRGRPGEPARAAADRADLGRGGRARS